MYKTRVNMWQWLERYMYYVFVLFLMESYKRDNIYFSTGLNLFKLHFDEIKIKATTFRQN